MPRLDLRAAFYGGPGFTLYHAWGPNSALPLSPHFHDEYLLCAQIKGEEQCEVNGKSQRFSPGELVLINPRQVHTGNQTGNQELEYLSLYLDRPFVESIAAALDAPSPSPEFSVVRAGAQPELLARMFALLELVRAGGQPQRLDSALRELTLLAFEKFSNLRQPQLRSTKRVAHHKIARALDFIQSREPSHDAADISLDELAEVAELSKFHFLRLFSQVVGMTPGAYLRTLRLCQAARKLRSSSRSILEIALEVGFADHPSFTRAFARHMGMTPSEYQRLGPI